VLVTSAGIQARGTLDQLSVQELRACLEVNVVGTWLACRAAAAPTVTPGRQRSWQGYAMQSRPSLSHRVISAKPAYEP